MCKVAKLSKIFKFFFTEKADDLSIITGFIQRKQKLTGSSFIKTLILTSVRD